MKIRTITTDFLFTMAVHSSIDQTREEIISCTPNCVTPYNQQPKQSMEINTITTYFIFTRAVHYSKDQTMAEISSCTPYFTTPCNH